MDEDMEDNTVIFTFTAVEIDLDYEFDAPRYFDFCREESLTEARNAEIWFQSAQTYPPSPFVTKLLMRKDILMENVTTSPKNKNLESVAVDENVGEVEQEVSAMDMSNREYEGAKGRISVDVKSCVLPNFNQINCIPTGLTFYNHALDSKSKRNTTAKPSISRTSTLMKPTASQLAKQNRSHQVGDYRFLKFENKEKSVNNPSTLESQAAKRQKLEGGQLRKVADTNQQVHLVHKEPKRDINIDGNSVHAKLRLTIPRQPDLKTAHRAQRMRPKVSTECGKETSTAPTFRALPLNRKILEGPSLIPKRSTPQLPEFQEFHLKTLERAMQHNSTAPRDLVHHTNSKVSHQPCPGSIAECSNRDARRSNFIAAAQKPVGSEVPHTFRALPLNKKILSSKGDLGVFRNSKRETTVPKEFNLHTERRVQHDPPIELFNKLTLTSELQTNTGSLLKLPQSTCSTAKGSKENRCGSLQQDNEIKNMVQAMTPRFKVNQIPAHGGVTKIGSLASTNRSSGIR